MPTKMKNGTRIDPEKLKITDAPLPLARAQPRNMYDNLFDKLKYGQCVECASNEVGAVTGALRSYLKRKARSGDIRSSTRIDDGKGRIHGGVWLMAPAVSAIGAKFNKIVERETAKEKCAA